MQGSGGEETQGTKVVLFDGDDTLWSTEELYDEARSAARDIVAAAGLDGDEWEQLERTLDVANVAGLGFSPQRFPASCVQAYEQQCESHGVPLQPAITSKIWDAARTVFERHPPIKIGARETLSALRARGIRLALLTKGHPEVQERRIEHSGLRQYFDLVHIVAEKSPQAILDMVTALGGDPGNSWMVGNSVRSDVLPALKAGLHAIWIDAHVWEYERAHDDLVDHRVATASRHSG